MEDEIIPLEIDEVDHKEGEVSEEPHLNLKIISNWDNDENLCVIYTNYLVAKKIPINGKPYAKIKDSVWRLCIIYDSKGRPQLYGKVKELQP